MNIKACLSSNSDNWKTPINIFNAFMNKGYIDTFKYLSDENELNNNYKNSKLFINPPFSIMEVVITWVINQYFNNNDIALLIPARTDTRYFHRLLKIIDNAIIYFIKGRLRYNESNPAPFPTILIILKHGETGGTIRQ